MTLRETIMSASEPLRRTRSLALMLPWLVTAVGGLAVAAWLTRLEVGDRASWAVVAWALSAAAVGIATTRWFQARRRFGAAAVAQRLESVGGWRRGALTTLLEPLAGGTSLSLHQAATEREVARVERDATATLAADLGGQRRRARDLLLGVAVAAVALVLARPLAGAGNSLMLPWQAWRALTAPVDLSTATPVVDRGESATLLLTALGQRTATLMLRSPGEAWHEQVVELSPAGTARFITPPLAGELVARLESAGRSSPELRIAVRLPAFMGSFTLRADYPRYLGRESEELPTTGDTLLLPAGTRLRLAGTATAPLSQAWISSARDSLNLKIRHGEFDGEYTPEGDGTWQLGALTVDGGPLEGLPAAIPIRMIADSAPVVNLPVPGADTVASPSHLLPLVIAIEDDHGLTSAWLEMWRGQGTVRRRPLELQNVVDRALVAITMDLDSFGVTAGDTVHYLAVATDNAPGRGLGKSRVFTVVVPTAAEERNARAALTAAATTALDTLVSEARGVERMTEDLARERQRGAGSAGEDGPMSAEAVRRAEQAAAAQEVVARRLAEMRQRLGELERQASERGEVDSALANDLRDIRKLLEQAMTPELEQAMAALRESLRKLDHEGARDALAALAQQQHQMREAIERARELFERAALETTLATLADEAKELSSAQRKAIARLQADSQAGAQTEQRLADRTDSLAAQLADAAERAPGETVPEGLNRVSKAAKSAANAMRSAAESAEQGERSQAAEQATTAAEELEPLAEMIEQQRGAAQEEMREDVLADLNRLLSETTRVLSRQYAVAEAFRRGAVVGPLRAEEVMLEEATAKLLQQVIVVAGKNALISPRISVALAGARDGLRGALEATSAAAPSLGLAADRAGDAVDMLSLAAYSLLQSSRNIEQSESGSGLAEAMKQMAELAAKQNAAAGQGQSMRQKGDTPGAGELLQLAIQQRAIAQQLERMRAEGQLPGSGELANEAQDVARQIEAGRLSAEIVERQQALFRRMLDAGRSLEGDQDEQSSERQSESAKAQDTARPAALDPRLLRGPEFKVPSWDELQKLAPDDRRRVIDYFRILTEAGRP